MRPVDWKVKSVEELYTKRKSGKKYKKNLPPKNENWRSLSLSWKCFPGILLFLPKFFTIRSILLRSSWVYVWECFGQGSCCKLRGYQRRFPIPSLPILSCYRKVAFFLSWCWSHTGCLTACLPNGNWSAWLFVGGRHLVVIGAMFDSAVLLWWRCFGCSWSCCCRLISLGASSLH